MRESIKFLRKKGILLPGFTHWIVRFPNKQDIDLVDLLDEFEQLTLKSIQRHKTKWPSRKDSRRGPSKPVVNNGHAYETDLNRFHLDLHDEGYWLMVSNHGNRYPAGDDKEKAQALIARLNTEGGWRISKGTEIPNGSFNEIYVCWGNHKSNEPCNFIPEI